MESMAVAGRVAVGSGRRGGYHEVASGKFLTFLLAGEEYGVPVARVQEIVGLMPVTPLPGSPPHVRGVANLRGTVVPILDMRARLGLPSADGIDRVIIVVRLDTRRVGLFVDRVCEVMHIDHSMIEAPPTVGSADASSLILGLAKADGRVRVLLDLAHVVAFEAQPGFEPATADRSSAAA